ncbi:MAG: glycosyltransferase family 2 protein [Desulfobacteraceae bacterium]|nr:glycosyltransferase family 2 protein [Desulfobacteraceae bacterium]
MATVSILMNCHNCSKYLEESLDSIYQQTYQDFEIVFIDNCSDDGTNTIVNQYDKRLKYYQTPHFMTLGEARSFGLQFCKSKYLAFLDTDDTWCPTILEKSINILNDKGNDYSMTYANIAFIDEKSKVD